MLRPRHKTLALAWGCGLLFVLGMTHLFLLRFEAGDVYPPYSSFRSDPLGSRALFESLNLIADHTARRNYRPMDQVALGNGRTLLVCGLPDGDRSLRNPFWERVMDRLAQEGGRLVLTFRPASRPTEEKETDKATDEAGHDQDETGPQSQSVEKGETSKEDCTDATEDNPRWCGHHSLGFELQQSHRMDAEAMALRTGQGPGVLPPAIAHRAPVAFLLHDETWQTVYAWNGAPVVMSRTWGNGTLVMAADSYHFSNEALGAEASAGLLAWFVGPGQVVIFDESHHGLVKRPGIANLARKYRLHGFITTLLLLTLLFVWRRTAVFVPPQADTALSSVSSHPTGGGTSEGLVNLMQQHIDAKDLLQVCHDAWRTSLAGRVPHATLTHVETLIRNQAGQDPVARYRQICELLEQGKRL